MGLRYYLHDTRHSLPAAGGVLFLVLAGLMVFRRKSRRVG